MRDLGVGAIAFVIIIAAAFIVVRNDKKEEAKNLENNTQTEETNMSDSTNPVNTETSNTNKNSTNPVATFVTNHGTFKVELFLDKTPKTAGNMITLVEKGFYNSTKFHRVIKGFMIQGGDPLTKDDSMSSRWGTGDPGYKFADEFGVGLSNVKGTISMANSGPNTNGSQFFINTADNTFLDGKHSVFGRVIEGLDVVAKIESTPTLARDVPASVVVVESVSVK